MFHAPENARSAIAQALHPLRQVDVKFDVLGSRIIFYDY